MSKVRRVANTGVLPDKVIWLEFPRSDGDPSNWPKNTTSEVDHEGHVNFFLPLSLGDGANIRWRIQVGEKVAEVLKKPEVKDHTYVLKDFPENYRLFDHHKGPQANPRHDLYLHGPARKRFRSIFEFVPHAVWLIDGSKPCECKYCTNNKSQREITAKVLGHPSPSFSQSPGPSARHKLRDKGKPRELHGSRLRDHAKKETRSYASVQRVWIPLKAAPGVQKTPMLVERNSDLRAIYSKTSMNLRRWYREGEVVWSVLKRPIYGPEGSGVVIKVWPGVVEEVKLQTVPISRNTSNSGAPRPAPRVNNHPPKDSPTTGPMLEPDLIPLPWTIRQSTMYKIQLFAISHSVTLLDEEVLPHQSYIPSQEILSFMETLPPQRFIPQKEVLFNFNPFPSEASQGVDINEALPPFALALQIASHISDRWSLTDEYEVLFAVSTTPPSTPSRPPLPSRMQRPPLPAALHFDAPGSTDTSTASISAPLVHQTLPPAPNTFQEVLNMAGPSNTGTTVGITSHSYYRNINGVDPAMSPERVRKNAETLLGLPPPPGNLTQLRFQGAWWGGERIWVGDFIRLKQPRRMIAPQGTEEILAPAGAGKRTLEECKAAGWDPEEMGAGGRGVFLRLDGIFAVDVPEEGGPGRKEARVCGMLYELVDEDWEEDTAKGKGRVEADGDVIMAGPEAPPIVPPVGPSNGSRDPPHPTPTGLRPGLDAVYLMPEAPHGYKFRPILRPGHEFIGAMGIISGRYYPRILSHPKIAPELEAALDVTRGEGRSEVYHNFWALEGLSGGYFNSVDPHRYSGSRKIMMQEADRDAVRQITEWAQRLVDSTRGGVVPNSIVVSELVT